MKRKDQILGRMYVVLALFCIVPLLVIGQIGRIVVTEGDTLEQQGREQARSSQAIPAMRGALLDRNGRALAINTARYDLALDPTVEGFADQAETFYEQLATLTGRTAAHFRETVDTRYSRQYVLLHRGLTENQHDTIATWDVPGLIITPRFDRRYNYGRTAAHVLGHVGGEMEGLAGLELQYDAVLKGTPGRRAVQRDRRGRIKALVGGSVVEPAHGDNLVLTLDLVRQTALEDELRRGVVQSGAAWGTAVAMDPETGAILAMANVPTYDPNQPGRAQGGARRNRAITDRFEPGSTFKLVTAAAAVEQDLLSVEDTVQTGDGWVTLNGRTINDEGAYGAIPFADVIAKSSNVGVAKTAIQIDPGIFYQYARNFGFGHATWIDLPGEVSGVLKKPHTWSRTTHASMSIGYEVAVTPLQVLAAYAALANGGVLMQPYLVAERRAFDGEVLWRNEPDSIRRALREETAAALRPAFQKVVDHGTATGARVDGLAIAGKTGTALKVSGGRYSRALARASFVGFFPADDPEVALMILVGEPKTSIYGGAVAAPIFRRVARRWVNTFPTVVDRLVAASDSLPPPAPAPPAASPAASAPVQRAALPDTLTDTLPDLRGQSARDATYWLHSHGVDVRIRGTGVVRRQDPAPGAPLPTRIVLTCAP